MPAANWQRGCSLRQKIEAGDENRVEVDFDKAFTKLLAEEEWKTIGKVDVILLSLKENLKLADASDISKLEGLIGKIYRLTAATVVGLEETARVGDYVNVRFEVESNRWKKRPFISKTT